MNRTIGQLFKPFRLGRWLRLAVVCFLTGELTGGGGWSGVNVPTGRQSGGGSSHLADSAPAFDVRFLLQYLPWILLVVFALVMLLLLMIYISSVYRFILFESVVYDRCELGEGWRRWQQQGSSFFLWQISYSLATMAVFAAVIGGPILLAWAAGLFSEPKRHLFALILGALAVFLLFVGVLLASILGSVLAKDFVVPVMALENLGVLEGWRRVLPMLGAEKGAYTLYILMKMLLAIGAALAFGIIDFLVLLMMLVPTAILAVVVVLLAKAAELTWTPVTIIAAISGGVVIFGLIFFVVSLVSAPPMVFFQAYTLHFFGSRYPRLEEQLSLASPGAAPAAPAATT